MTDASNWVQSLQELSQLGQPPPPPSPHHLHVVDTGSAQPRTRWITACDCGWWLEAGPKAIGPALREYAAHIQETGT